MNAHSFELQAVHVSSLLFFRILSGMLQEAVPSVLDPRADSVQRVACVPAWMQSIGRYVVRHATALDGKHAAAWRAHWLLAARTSWARRDEGASGCAVEELGDAEASSLLVSSDGSRIESLDEEPFPASLGRARTEQTLSELASGGRLEGPQGDQDQRNARSRAARQLALCSPRRRLVQRLEVVGVERGGCSVMRQVLQASLLALGAQSSATHSASLPALVSAPLFVRWPPMFTCGACRRGRSRM